MKTTFLKWGMTIFVFCIAFTSCKEDKDCEPCFTITKFSNEDKTCESDLASPEAYQDSLAAAKVEEQNGFGAVTVEESEECN
jgi:hypothetical protein